MKIQHLGMNFKNNIRYITPIAAGGTTEKVKVSLAELAEKLASTAGKLAIEGTVTLKEQADG